MSLLERYWTWVDEYYRAGRFRALSARFGDDALQEALVRVGRYIQRNPDRLIIDQNFRAYLWRATYNTWVDQHRQDKQPLSLDNTRIESRDNVAAEAIASVTLKHVLERIRHEGQLTVRSAEPYELLLLSATGLSHREISQRTGRSESAVKACLHRCRERLRA